MYTLKRKYKFIKKFVASFIVKLVFNKYLLYQSNTILMNRDL